MSTSRHLAADLAGRPLDEDRLPARSARLPNLDEQEQRAWRCEQERQRDERRKRAEAARRRTP